MSAWRLFGATLAGFAVGVQLLLRGPHLGRVVAGKARRGECGH